MEGGRIRPRLDREESVLVYRGLEELAFLSRDIDETRDIIMLLGRLRLAMRAAGTEGAIGD